MFCNVVINSILHRKGNNLYRQKQINLLLFIEKILQFRLFDYFKAFNTCSAIAFMPFTLGCPDCLSMSFN